ncbi:hypothetical protein [Streptomyces sp. NPDC053079]|uniref:hypothetical protein n=1 Tax=Streptomyces sp. NPDC053079 TaxID=3365697 RepID=UPI0037D37FF1
MHVTICRQHSQQREVVFAPRTADPATCAVEAAQRLLSSLHAAGRTEGPLFVRVSGREGWVTTPATQNGRPVYDPTGRLMAANVVNIMMRLSWKAGLELHCDWRSDSLRRCFVTATERTP